MEYNRSDIRNIAFEKINDRFSKGTYLGIKVTIDMTNGYINGPHLVGQVLTKGGKPKQLYEWKRSSEAIEIIEYLITEISVIDIIKDVTDAPNGLRGAYIHPRLVSHVAQWASPIFADKVAIIINSKAIEDAILEKNIEIKSLKDTVKHIEQQNIEQSKQIAELLGYAKKTDIDLENTQIELENVSAEIEKTSEQLTTVQTKLGIVVQHRVIPDPIDHRNEIFAIYRHTNELIKYRVIDAKLRAGLNLNQGVELQDILSKCIITAILMQLMYGIESNYHYL